LSARAAYVAEHSSHEWVPIELNSTVNGTPIYYPSGCTATSSNCINGTITEASTSANTNYNSLSFQQSNAYATV
jgi:hypothetical protein